MYHVALSVFIVRFFFSLLLVLLAAEIPKWGAPTILASGLVILHSDSVTSTFKKPQSRKKKGVVRESRSEVKKHVS